METIYQERFERMVENQRKAVSNYYQRNKATLNEKNKAYYQKHKEALALKRKQKIELAKLSKVIQN